MDYVLVEKGRKFSFWDNECRMFMKDETDKNIFDGICEKFEGDGLILERYVDYRECEPKEYINFYNSKYSMLIQNELTYSKKDYDEEDFGIVSRDIIILDDMCNIIKAVRYQIDTNSHKPKLTEKIDIDKESLKQNINFSYTDFLLKQYESEMIESELKFNYLRKINNTLRTKEF